MPGFDIGLRNACQDNTIQGRLSGPSNIEETARRYRYEFQVLEPLDNASLLLFAYKAARPSPEIDIITIHSGQDEIYRPGKNRWKPIDITFYERVQPKSENEYYSQAAELLYKWWGGTPYNTDARSYGMIHLDRSLQGQKYRKPCQLAMLDGYGEPVWSYYLVNSWPSKITPCDLSYADTEISDITVTLVFDKAIEQRKF